MIFIYMIITALVPAALAKGSMECHISKSTAVQLCFGALGEPMNFHLPTNATKIMLKRNKNFTILNISKNKGTQDGEYFRQAVFVSDTIFKTDGVTKKLSGCYLLEMFSGAELKHTVNIHLKIQAPVSKPAVSQICLSPEQMNISCSSEGDGVEFILTLDGYSLTQTRGHRRSLSGSTAATQSLTGITAEQDETIVSNVNISLHGQLIGNLKCNVRNNISDEETVISLTSCKDSICHFHAVTVALIAGAALFLATLPLAVFLGIKHRRQERSTTVNEGNTEDEVIYSDVKVKNTRKTRSNKNKNSAEFSLTVSP